MDPKIKGVIVLGVLVTAIFFLMPTYEAYKPGSDPQKIKNKVSLGLDLQGGMYLDVEVDTSAAVSRVLDLLAQEIEDLLLEKLVNYVSIERRENTVEVELAAGEKIDWKSPDFERIIRSVELTTVSDKLFSLRLPPDEIKRVETGSVSQALEVIRNRIDSLGVSEPSIQQQGKTNLLIQLPGLRDRESAIEAIGTQAVLEFYLVADNVTPQTMTTGKHVLKKQEIRDATTKKLIGEEPYVLMKKAVLSGDTVRDARVAISTQDNTPYVSISFNSFGSDRFGKVTTRNRGRRLAIVLDDKVQSAPVIREAITGGEAQISGRFTMKEATNLAIVLRSGSLPAPITIREERTVGATLGEDSIRQGLMSLAVGGIMVMIFIMVYYRVPGMFASFALIFNLILILAVLAKFQASLTLPGIAGIVLTMGMSVDANVLIFERIREEMTRTGNPRTAIGEGFQKAFWTIFDSNLTTLVAAFALLAFGTGPIKGFAVTLAIGIMASMFTAIVVTRLLFDLVYLNRRRLESLHI